VYLVQKAFRPEAVVDIHRARFHEAVRRAADTVTLAERARPESVSRLSRVRSARSSAAL
jgi:glucuronate isomerase